MTPEQIKAVLVANGLTDKPAEYDSDIHSYRCRYPDTYGPCSCLQELVNDLAALLPVATETVEWGAKYTNGHVASCGWLEGISEHLARTATQPPDLTKGVRIGQPQAVAVVTRIRRASLTVTEWTEVAS